MKSLTRKEIEHIHDVLVGAFLPFDEKVSPAELRDHAMIESSLGRPFHTVFGADAWPTLAQKGAVLFHSLVCNHCFLNGNKRTAVIALDLFLGINHSFLTLTPAAIYELAVETAMANAKGRRSSEVVNTLAETLDNCMISPDRVRESGIEGIDVEATISSITRLLSYALTSQSS